MPTRIHFNNYGLSVPESIDGLKDLIEEVTEWAAENDVTETNPGGNMSINIEFSSCYEDEEVSVNASCYRDRTEEEEEELTQANEARKAQRLVHNKLMHTRQIREAFLADPDAVRELVVELSNAEGGN